MKCDGHLMEVDGITVEDAKALVALQMENEEWRSVEEVQDYLSQHWDYENRRSIP